MMERMEMMKKIKAKAGGSGANQDDDDEDDDEDEDDSEGSDSPMKLQSSKVLGFPSSRGGRGAGPQQGMTRGQASSARGGRGAGPQAAMGRGAAPATGPMAQMAAMTMG